MKLLNNIYIGWIGLGAVMMALGVYKLAVGSSLRGAAVIAIGGVMVGVGIAKYRQRKV